jgi:lipoyl-dependent peroxiredoxin
MDVTSSEAEAGRSDMAIRKADAGWDGTLKEGAGTFRVGSGAFEGAFTAGTRFGDDAGTNPEELIAAASAACFSMALSADLGNAGYTPISVRTTAEVKLEKPVAWTVVGITLNTEATIEGVDEAEFQKIADGTRQNCPISRALAAVPITLNATLVA